VVTSPHVLRRATWWVCVAAIAWLGGCWWIPDADRDHARGSAVAATLLVRATAAEVATLRSARPRPFCRPPVPLDGPLRIETDLVYARKHGPFPSERIIERRTWTRDATGSVAARTEVHAALPDGRPTVRTIESRRVDGMTYRALDDRFVDASRVPSIDQEIASAALEGVDSVLALVALERGQLVAASHDNALCEASLGIALPNPEAGAYTLAYHGRSGWIRWRDTRDTSLTVTFSERISVPDADTEERILAPTELWEVEADTSYRDVTRFIAFGQRSGVFGPPRDLFDTDASDASDASDPSDP